MMKDPAVLFYASDFLTGTMFMDYDTKGRYITLLALQQQTGPIKEKNFKEICGDKFEEISEKFQQDSKGNYYNKRMKYETDRRKKFTESRRANGSKGGRPPKAKGKQGESYEKPLGLSTDNLMGNETEIEKENEKGLNKVGEMTRAVLSKLNGLCGTRYKATSEKTKGLVKARMNEGFTLADFETVIEKKAAEWTGTEYEKFLRPETLFGPKFESYLNQKSTKKGGNKFLDYIGGQHDEGRNS